MRPGERSTGQPLWCDPCGRLHRFSQCDLELIVYAAQAHVCDLDSEISRDGRPPREPYTLDCLFEFLGMAVDGEVYGEHTESLVAQRKLTAKLQVEQASRAIARGTR